MKKLMFVVLAVLMILPVIVSCSSAPEGNPVVVSNVKLITYDAAYAEDGTRGEGAVIYEGEVTAYVAEGATLTVKDVVEGYVYANNDNAVTNDVGMYETLAGYTANEEFLWNYYVNGKEANLSATVKETDTIEIVYEK